MRKTLALGILFAMPACGGGSSTPTPVSTLPPAPTQSVVVATVAPTPVLAVPSTQRPNFCPGGDRDFTAAWSTTIRETAGLGGNVNFINVTAKDAAGFELFRAPLNFDVNYIIRKANTNHVAGSGQIVVADMGMCYTLGTGQRSLHVVQITNFTDDRAHVLNVQTEFDIF